MREGPIVKCISRLLILFISLLLIQGSSAIEISFSASNGVESVSIWDRYLISDSVSVSETAVASFGSVAITGSREVSGSGDINMLQEYSGSSGYNGHTDINAQDASSIRLTGSASLTPETLGVSHSTNITGASQIGIEDYAFDEGAFSQVTINVNNGDFSGDTTLSAGHSTDINSDSTLTGSFDSTVQATGSAPSTRSTAGGVQMNLYLHVQTPTVPLITDIAAFYVVPGFMIQSAIDAARTGDEINVAAGTYEENNITIDKSLTITGAGAESTIVDAGKVNRVFSIGLANPVIDVVLSGLMIQNGSASRGGGIYNNATLTISNCDIYNNQVSATGINAYAYGGGIYSSGNVNLNYSNVSHNSVSATGDLAKAEGGGIYSSGNLNLNNSNVSYNSASASSLVDPAYAYGGGIYSSGNVNLNYSNVSYNSASASSLMYSAYAYGGGIYSSGNVNLNNSNVSYNSASASSLVDSAYAYGGGIYNTGTVNLKDSSNVSFNIALNGSGIYNNGPGTLKIYDNCNIFNNTASNSGGGIYNGKYATLNLYGGNIFNNSADSSKPKSGGGIFNETSGTITGLENCIFYGNVPGNFSW